LLLSGLERSDSDSNSISCEARGPGSRVVRVLGWEADLRAEPHASGA